MQDQYEQWRDGTGPFAKQTNHRKPNVLEAIRKAKPIDGLDEALTLAEEHNTPQVRQALLERANPAAEPDGTVRVNMAALLYFLCGKSQEAFDWDHRPFFLRFADGESLADVERAWQELKAVADQFEKGRRTNK